MKQQLEDYGISFDHIPIRCDNTSAINLTKNPIQHSHTKYIKIRYHFIKDHVQKGNIELDFVSTEMRFADIFTKPLSEDRFCMIRRELGMSNPICWWALMSYILCVFNCNQMCAIYVLNSLYAFAQSC